MRTRVVLLTAIALLAVAGPAVASTFTFSYTFGSGQVVSGSFTGTRNDNGTTANLLDDFVSNPTFGSVLYQGTPMAGPIYANQYDQFGWIGGPTSVYFTGTSNNFILSVCPGPAVCAVSNWEYFVMRTIPQGFVGAQYYLQSPETIASDSSISAARWSLTEVSTIPAAAVPEPATLTLLGLGLAGIATAVRRRRR